MPAPGAEEQMGAQAGAEQAGIEEQVAMMAEQIVTELGPEGAAMLAEMIMQMLQGGAEQPQPTYQRKGGKLVRVR